MKIGVIGAGLIGGSLILALHEKNYEIAVVSGNPETREKLILLNIEASGDLNIIKNCDVVFVCTPMNKTEEILDRLEGVVSERTIVSDVSSLKNFVMKKRRPYRFIGSHPMAGTENSGFSFAFKELFTGAKWILTPAFDIQESEISALEEIIKKTGAKTLIMTPEEHDRAAAFISHMPMLVSQALMDCATGEEKALLIASSGFRDMTRLSVSNPEMAEDMIKMNNENIKYALEALINSAQKLLDGNYREKIEKIRQFRKNMYDENGRNLLS